MDQSRPSPPPGDEESHSSGELARRRLESELSSTDDPEKQAFYCLKLGALMEDLQDFESAARWYSRGHALEPLDPSVSYFLNNNLGYSLNQLGRFVEAEGYCRIAIEVDGARHNAHKNLGVALNGQKFFAEAAACFVTATRACPQDGRALLLLQKLVAEQPELLSEAPELAKDLEKLLKALAAPAPPAKMGRAAPWLSWHALVSLVNPLAGWKFRERDLPGIQPVVSYVGIDGEPVTPEEMLPECSYRWTLEDRGDLPRRAFELHGAGLEAGQRGCSREAMELFRRAHLAAPRWAQPVYQAAWTALLQDKNRVAQTLYAWTDRMVPDGYWMTKTALDCLSREAAGEFPPHAYRAYVSLEHLSNRAAMTEEMVDLVPTFAPAWKDLAVLRTSPAGREEAVTRGFESRPDRETKAFLHIHHASLLNSQGRRDEARAVLQDLLGGSEATIQTRALANIVLHRIAPEV